MHYYNFFVHHHFTIIVYTFPIHDGEFMASLNNDSAIETVLDTLTIFYVIVEVLFSIKHNDITFGGVTISSPGKCFVDVTASLSLCYHSHVIEAIAHNINERKAATCLQS
jgi:hypothetical protein